MAPGKFLQIKADANFANSTLFYDKKAKHVAYCPRAEEVDHAYVTISPTHTNPVIVCTKFPRRIQ